MNLQEGYQSLVSIRERQKVDIKPEELHYFEEEGLVHSITVRQYHELTDLLQQHASLFDELRGLHMHIEYPPSVWWGGNWEYQRLSSKVQSRWHRLFSKRAKLREEEAELKSMTEQLEALQKDTQNRYPPLRDKYEGLTSRINDLLQDSEAWRAWGVYIPDGRWEFCLALKGKGLGLVGPEPSQSCSLNDYAGLIPTNTSNYLMEALETYFQINNSDYVSISRNGRLVVEGIVGAGLQDENQFDFDTALDLVEVIMTKHRYSGVTSDPKPIKWDLIDVRGSLSRIRNLRSSGKQFEIEFSPAYTIPRNPGGSEYFPEPWPEEFHEQIFSIVEK